VQIVLKFDEQVYEIVMPVLKNGALHREEPRV
jgi:hypothetical protein